MTTVGANVTNYNATGLTGGTQYRFRATAIADNGVSDASGGVQATTKPLTPSGLSATDNADMTVAVKWNPVAGADSYELQRRKGSSGPWITLVSATSITFTDDGGDHFSNYQFQVRAHDTSGFSDFSPAGSHSVAPKAPTNLHWTSRSVWQYSYPNYAYFDGIAWDAGSSNSAAYQMQWTSDGVTYNPPATSGAFSFQGTSSVVPDVAINVRVRAVTTANSRWVYLKNEQGPHPDTRSFPASWSGTLVSTMLLGLSPEFNPDGSIAIDSLDFTPSAGAYSLYRRRKSEDDPLTGIEPVDSGWQKIADLTGNQTYLDSADPDDWELQDSNGDGWQDAPVDSYYWAVRANAPAPSDDFLSDLVVKPPIDLSSEQISANFTASIDADGFLHVQSTGDFSVSRDMVHWVPAQCISGEVYLNFSGYSYGPQIRAQAGENLYVRRVYQDSETGKYHWTTPVTVSRPGLAAPTHLTAVTTASHFYLNWHDDQSAATSYDIEASVDGIHFYNFYSEPAGNPISAYPPFYKVAAGEHSLDANPETFRYFRVRAINNAIYPSVYQGPLEGHSPWAAAAEITAAPTLQLTAHRTGGHFGDAVSRSVQDGGNPADFVVLTNNDYEEHDDFSAKDFDDNTALIVDDQVQANGDGPADDDLVQLTLSQLPSTLTNGTFTLAASDPSAVRFFDDQGQELTSLLVNLANPTGYLAGLTTGDVDVWMEGLHKSSDLIIKTGYTDPAGNEIARDTVHMLLAEWNIIGKSGNPVLTVAKDSQQLLLDQLTADPNVPIAGDDVFFKNKIDGLPSSAVTSLTVTSDSIATDSYVDDFGSDSSVTQSSDWSALFVPEPDTPDLTAAQLTALKNNDQLNVVHNPAGDEKLQTKDGNNFVRKVPGKPQDDGQKIYDLLTADPGYGEKVKFLLDRMDWNNDSTDYHKRLVFQSMHMDAYSSNGVVYVNTGGTDVQTKAWALDGLRQWAGQGARLEGEMFSEPITGQPKPVKESQIYFARITRQWARHFYWQLDTNVPTNEHLTTPAGKNRPWYVGTVDPLHSTNAAVLALTQTLDFLTLFSSQFATDHSAWMYDPLQPPPNGNKTISGLPKIFLWVFTNRTSIVDSHQHPAYEVNIPSTLGLNADYWESDTLDPNNKVHDTNPDILSATPIWPSEDQLHHFSGYFYLGLSASGTPATDNFILHHAFSATQDLPKSNNPGDYNLGIVGYYFGSKWIESHSYHASDVLLTKLLAESWQDACADLGVSTTTGDLP